MYESNNTSLATAATGFILPMAADCDFTAEDLAEDTFGMQINFTRVKIPSGGGLAFEVPQADSNRPEITQTLQGIILYHHPYNAFWPLDKDDKNSPPSCSSVDGVCGVGNPGMTCKECPNNQWGSGKKGSGKACKNGFSLYLLRSGEFLPIHVQLPPTSIKPFSDFVVSFRKRMRKVCGSLVEIGLRKDTNAGGDDYSVATFRLLQDYTGPELRNLMEYANGMKAQIKTMNDQRATTPIEQYSEVSAYDSYGYPAYHDEEVPPSYGGFYDLPDSEGLPA